MTALAPAPDPDAPAYALDLTGLAKTYRARGKSGPVVALDHINLKVPRGAIFGLLGPNGAGKSTTINILGGLVIKTAGTARIWRHDLDQAPRAARAAIGIVTQEIAVDPFFTAREALELQAGLYGVPRAERRTQAILDAVGLADKADAHARTLSGGMRRRLMVAKAMVHRPPILVLDEPTAGVDVELRQQLWTMVRGLNRAGVTILLTTHYLEEAQALCDRIAIINHGRLVAHDTTEALLARIDAKSALMTLTEELPAELPPMLGQIGLVIDGPRRLRLNYRPSRTELGPILGAIAAEGLTVADISTEEASLQDIFLQLTRAESAAA